VLHTNDVHSYIDPFPADHPEMLMGGVARRAYIETIRKENQMYYYLMQAIFFRELRTLIIMVEN
jgi:2',3'-cyclic-nucleotide 2'-phosphodiesterase (5'-nucleotidase family)